MPCQIHRYNGKVALFIRSPESERGHTAYFTPAEAICIAGALNEYVRDCMRVKDADSKIGTYRMGGV